MEDNKISQFIQALKFFDLELEEITGQPGYESRNKVIAIRKKAIIPEYCVLIPATTNCLTGQDNNSATPINTSA